MERSPLVVVLLGVLVVGLVVLRVVLRRRRWGARAAGSRGIPASRIPSWLLGAVCIGGAAVVAWGILRWDQDLNEGGRYRPGWLMAVVGLVLVVGPAHVLWKRSRGEVSSLEEREEPSR